MGEALGSIPRNHKKRKSNSGQQLLLALLVLNMIIVADQLVGVRVHWDQFILPS
jgi:hypothetical protein